MNLKMIYRQLDEYQNKFDARKLNLLNKKIRHLKKIKEMKIKFKDELKKQAVQPSVCQQLLKVADPFIAQKYANFIKCSKTQRGPSFLERMQQDSFIRKTINDVHMVPPSRRN